jgi:hypothetical protein
MADRQRLHPAPRDPRCAQGHAPRFYRDLPRLAAARIRRTAAVWFVARGALDAVDMQPGLNSLTTFVSAYQEGRELAIVELWALPTMLRLACLETLIAGCAELFPGLAAPFDFERRDGWSARHDPTESVARAITAISALATLPWKDFFDRTSLVDAALRRDPAGSMPAWISKAAISTARRSRTWAAAAAGWRPRWWGGPSRCPPHCRRIRGAAMSDTG